MSNTVTPSNFNQTMEGYTDYALDFVLKRLHEKGYDREQLIEMRTLIRNGFRWGKDEMSMEDARNYETKFDIYDLDDGDVSDLLRRNRK